MDFNKAGTSTEQKVSFEDVIKNIEDISKRSNEDLEGFLDEANKDKNYGAIAILAKELESRPKVDVSKQLAESTIKTDEENREFQETIDTEKQTQNIQDENKISELTAQLNDSNEKIGTLEQKINELLEAQKENTSKTSQSLEDLLKSKKSGDSVTVNRLLEEIFKLNKEKKALEEKSKSEILKYPESEIATMNTKLIKGRWISKKTIKTPDGNETTIKRPSLKINKNIRSRRKLNQVVKSFNGFKTDSDSAVKYILTQERQSRAEHITGAVALDQSINRGRYNLLHKTGFVMSKAKFEDKFDVQQKKIIDQFKNNINPAQGSAEDKTIKALEARMKYYKQDYTKKHYGA